ncbi:MAG TPA: hypothetical protein VGP33_16115 [Chloroflexota bacterium]|nr:hypothetical protein [Chloroflexota bacterium]
MPAHPGSIVQALLNAATLAPERPALLFNRDTWTYRRLLDAATA